MATFHIRLNFFSIEPFRMFSLPQQNLKYEYMTYNYIQSFESIVKTNLNPV